MVLKPLKEFTVCLFALLFLLTACGAPQVQVKQIQPTEDPSTELTSLTSAVFDGRQQQLNVLSPDWYAKAGEALEKARKGMTTGESSAKVLEEIAYGKAYIEKARDYARVAKTVIGDTIAARDAAIKADAMVFTREYQDLEEKLLDLTRSIEGGNVARAKNNSKKLTQGYSELELRAIKENTLGEVRKLIAIAEKQMAPKIAPLTLAEAKNALNEADRFISEHRYERERMQAKAAAALFQAKRLEQVMLQAKRIAQMTDEESYLWVEGLLSSTVELLNAPDMRNLAMKVQQQNVHGSIAALQKDNAYLRKKIKEDRAKLEEAIAGKQAEILEQKKRIAVLEGESLEARKARELLEAKEREAQAKLEAEHRFQQHFVEVQKMFTKEQGEVYKQGHDLVIRLKAIRFPVGQAFIMPENYDLLSSVRNAIQTFGSPDVIIEGHTDSTGSAAKNEQLSQQRANAVREYFVANQALKPEKVMAIGYGSERPLAANDTQEGRAINRRIDVIIRTAE